MSVKIDIRGLTELSGKVDRMIKEYPVEIKNELNAWADLTANDAMMMVPVDEGGIKKTIKPKYATDKELTAEVTVGANYAAYVEFGTRKYAASYVGSLPADWQIMAAERKGSGGGTFAEFISRIMGWMKRKGVEQKYLYPIALKILRDGIKPHPFLYPAYIKNVQKLKANLKTLFS